EIGMELALLKSPATGWRQLGIRAGGSAHGAMSSAGGEFSLIFRIQIPAPPWRNVGGMRKFFPAATARNYFLGTREDVTKSHSPPSSCAWKLSLRDCSPTLQVLPHCPRTQNAALPASESENWRRRPLICQRMGRFFTKNRGIKRLFLQRNTL